MSYLIAEACYAWLIIICRHYLILNVCGVLQYLLCWGELTTIMGHQSNFVTCIDYSTLISVCFWCALVLKYHIMKCSTLINGLLVQKLTHVLHKNANCNRSKHFINDEQIVLLEIKRINMSHIDYHYLLIFFIWKRSRYLHKTLT